MSEKQKLKEEITKTIQREEGFQTIGINVLQFALKSKTATLNELRDIVNYIRANERANKVFETLMEKDKRAKN